MGRSNERKPRPDGPRDFVARYPSMGYNDWRVEDLIRQVRGNRQLPALDDQEVRSRAVEMRELWDGSDLDPGKYNEFRLHVRGAQIDAMVEICTRDLMRTNIGAGEANRTALVRVDAGSTSLGLSVVTEACLRLVEDFDDF